MKRLLVLVILMLLWLPAAADPAHVRKPGESMTAFAKRVIPKENEAKWKPVAVSGFGPKGATLLLYGEEGGLSPLHGWLIYPNPSQPAGIQGEEYLFAPIPAQKFRSWAVYEVKDTFVGKNDKGPLLFVRAEHVTGIGPTGARPFSVTWVYRWDGKSLSPRQDLIDKIKQAESREEILSRADAHKP